MPEAVETVGLPDCIVLNPDHPEHFDKHVAQGLDLATPWHTKNQVRWTDLPAPLTHPSKIADHRSSGYNRSAPRLTDDGQLKVPATLFVRKGLNGTPSEPVQFPNSQAASGQDHHVVPKKQSRVLIAGTLAELNPPLQALS